MSETIEVLTTVTTSETVEVLSSATTIDITEFPVTVTLSNDPGPQGPAGAGVPQGGSAGEVLAKVSGTDFDTEWVDASASSLEQLTDVVIENLHNNDLLAYAQVSQTWTNVALPALVSNRFTQSTAASTWEVAHNLGFNPNVTVIDSGGNVVEGTVVYIDSNNIRLQFTAAFAGTAHLS